MAFIASPQKTLRKVPDWITGKEDAKFTKFRKPAGSKKWKNSIKTGA